MSTEDDFEDFLLTEAGIYASELVGPNSLEYEELTESLVEDEDFVQRMWRAYEDRRSKSGDCQDSGCS